MPKNKSETKRIEVFRPGTFTAMGGQSFSASSQDLIDLAERYDPENNPVPVVIGHPKTDTPAYGWVKSFSFEDDRLIAELDQLEPQFAEQVTDGRYKRISMSFFGKGSTANPAGDELYPKHIGFLGATPPAVSNLKPVEFSDEDESVTIEFGVPALKDVARLFRKIREFFIEEHGSEKADEVLSDWQINWIDDAGNDDKPNNFSDQNEDDPMGDKPNDKPIDLSAREKELDAREKRLKDQEAETTHKEHLAFADGLVKEGKLPTSEKETVVALLDGLADQADQPVSFGAGDEETSLSDLTKDLLSKLPKIVEFGETNLDDKIVESDNSPKAIAQAAKSYQFSQGEKGLTVSTSDAVAHIRKERGVTE
ncbi:hypothetical protein [Maritalea porphyrae]|uniref:hypothetical protein n=1 Tax=Maritalea porphyrae TaxID=880732 RepID=UPI0022AFD01E|nr:hypothetical protein [Maritalea porphyrae]MCZ4273311.1 hypothetical protein [Maritalea porphyrae]